MRQCDLIMKGGITSGVVYPYAITEIAAAYQLRGIGGSSAGAIAATLAAAAERRRQASPDKASKAGFEDIEKIADELAEDMKSLLQPSPSMAGLFDLLLAYVSPKEGKWRRLAGTLVRVYANCWLIGLLVFAIGALIALIGASFVMLVLALVAGLITTGILIALSVYRTLTKEVPRHDYGMLPGTTQSGSGKPGLTDWLADNIDRVAGKLGPDGEPDEPLTVGDLENDEVRVEIASISTDLTSQRPYRLPLRTPHHYFSKTEFETLFPERVMRYLTKGQSPIDARAEEGPADLYQLPHGDRFPVLLCARLSLSFPMLFQAVPLWRRDKGFTGKPDAEGPWRRCLFSDGGLSSNLPVHFFDAWLPRRPTFGIALTSYDPDWHGQERVFLSQEPPDRDRLRTRPIGGLLAFLMSLVNTAKDWQDTLQARLPGFAERIVEIRLEKSEGGMNLEMDRETRAHLIALGGQAGRKLVQDFDFDESRWRRALSVLPEMEASLESLAAAYASRPGDKTSLSYEELLTDYDPDYFKQNEAWRKEVLKPFVEDLALMGQGVPKDRDDPKKAILQDGNLPAQDASLRLHAEADRRPAKNGDGASGAR